MGRTMLSPQRLSETKKINIGRIIIFCEGKTEKYYFDYFVEIIKKNIKEMNPFTNLYELIEQFLVEIS
jgi:hypothetical protein